MIGLVRTVRDLFPDLSQKLDEVEKAMEQKAILPIRKKVEALEEELSNLSAMRLDLSEATKHLEGQKARYAMRLSQFLLLITAFMAVSAIAFQAEIVPLEARETALIMLMLSAGIISVLGFAYLRERAKGDTN
jgi:hypothetical protein